MVAAGRKRSPLGKLVEERAIALGEDPTRRGWEVALARTLGTSPQTIARVLSRTYYTPSEPLQHALAGWLDASVDEVASACGRTGTAPHRPPVTITCICGTTRSVPAWKADQPYCGRTCHAIARLKKRWDTFSTLQRNVVHRMEQRHITTSAVADETTIPLPALHSWLERPKALLTNKNLSCIAAWLDIPVTEAEPPWRGSAEAQRADILSRGANSPAQRAHFEWIRTPREDIPTRLKTDPAYKAWYEAEVGHLIGVPRPQDLKDTWAEKQRTIHADYRKREEEHGGVTALKQYTSSLANSVRAMLGMLEIRHEDWSATRIEREAVRRLQAEKYGGKSEDEAIALVCEARGRKVPEDRGTCAWAQEIDRLIDAERGPSRRKQPDGWWLSPTVKAVDHTTADPQRRYDRHLAECLRWHRRRRST